MSNITDLIKKVDELKESDVSEVIECRIKELEYNLSSIESVFKEVCFCIMTANFDAKRAIEIQKEIDDGFLNYSIGKLKSELKRLGYRFPNKRAEYIYEARSNKEKIFSVISNDEIDQHEKRIFIKNNIKGIGWKESSHLLRNLGFKDVAIIDFHIVDVLVNHNYIDKPKNLSSKKNYIKVENKIRKIAKKVNLDLARLDFYLWYIETGKVLK
ncbi:MAG: N-glycosylase/DNA lyase [Candidatus Woesearchaeota archaeon]